MDVPWDFCVRVNGTGDLYVAREAKWVCERGDTRVSHLLQGETREQG